METILEATVWGDMGLDGNECEYFGGCILCLYVRVRVGGCGSGGSCGVGCVGGGLGGEGIWG